MLKRVIIFTLLIYLVMITDQLNHYNVNQDNYERQVIYANRVKPVSKLENKSISSPFSYDNGLAIYENTTQYPQALTHRAEEELASIASHNTKQPEQDIALLKQSERKTFTKATTNWQLSFVFDNDIFANRDFYYTNGLKINLIAPFLNNSPVNKILLGSNKSDMVLCGFSITHNIYTPINPDTTIVLIGDRPFASYLLFGQFRETYHLQKKLHIKSEINIGVLGPSSFGRQVQTSFFSFHFILFVLFLNFCLFYF